MVVPDRLKHGWDRNRIMKEINAKGIPCGTGICGEIYLEKAFKNSGYAPLTKLPVAEALNQKSLMFLVDPTIQCEDIDRTIAAVQTTFKTAVS